MQISCLTLFQAQVLKLILQAMDHGNAVATAVMHNHKWLIIMAAILWRPFILLLGLAEGGTSLFEQVDMTFYVGQLS